MKIYEALQSNMGQSMANVAQPVVGVEIPGTGVDVPIPFVDYSFENKALLAAGVGVGVIGAIKGIRHQYKTNELSKVNYPAGADFGELTSKKMRKGRAKDFRQGALAVVGLTAATLSLAGPHNEEKNNTVDSAAVLVAADYGAYAEDVRVGDGYDSRLDAAVNVVKQMDLSGVSVEFFAVGTNPLSMGVLEDGSGSEEIVENFRDYSSVLSNRGSEGNGADFESALAAVDEADKVIVIGSLEDNDQTPILDGEDEESNRISAISMGVAGTTIDDFGQMIDAPYNPAFNSLVLGQDSYEASSDSEIEDVVGGIINDQIQTVERNDIEFFDKIAVGSLVLLGVGKYLRFGKKSKNNNPKKGK